MQAAVMNHNLKLVFAESGSGAYLLSATPSSRKRAPY